MNAALLLSALATLELGFQSQTGAVPKNYAPEHGVAVVRGDKVVVTRFEFVLDIPTGKNIPRSVVKRFPFEQVKGYSLSGKELSLEALRRRLRAPTPVLIQYASGEIELFYRNLYKKSSTVLVIPVSGPS